MNFLERIACRFLIWRFYEGYGAVCETSDLDDMPFTGTKLSARVMGKGRCSSCRAEETIAFLKEHIELI